MKSQTDMNPTAFIHRAGCSLGRAVAMELMRHGMSIALHDTNPDAVSTVRDLVVAEGGKAEVVAGEPNGCNPEESVIMETQRVFGRLDVLVNLCVFGTEARPSDVMFYPASLLARALAAAKAIAASSDRGAIINHCFLPSMYAGTELEDYISPLKGAITGITRVLCRKFGPSGIRVNCVQTGLLDLPEIKAVASAEVQQIKPPIGRWGQAMEVAKFVTFLAVRNGYMTGHPVIMDGGLTAGNTGT